MKFFIPIMGRLERKRGRNFLAALVFLSALFFAFVFIFSFQPYNANAAGGVPRILSYQGRLSDSSGNLLGGSGATYYFRFSIWSASSGGTQLWPAGTACSHALTVKDGVFNAGVGNTSECSDVLDFDFSSSDAVYLRVDVSSDNLTFETLTPKQRINSAAFALTAETLISTTTQSRLGTTTPIGLSLLTIESTSTSAIPLSIRAALGQIANLLQIQANNGSAIFTVSGSGSIGIASSTPAYTLGVAGTFGVTGLARFETAPRLSTILSCSGGQVLETDANGNIQCGTDDQSSGGGSDINWAFDSTEKNFIRLATTTNMIGIGTTSPYAKLSVESSTGAIATTTFALRPVTGQTANIIDIYNSSGALTDVLDSSNRLGLGTTSPSEILSIAGNILTTGTIQTTGSATSTWSTAGLSVAGGGLASSAGLT
ncbi:hypothetical protein HYT01_04145, partial [Candidatus Giovannonibacteria bacterium]|nr:hypothetical protein [Candidatus Giovannonibacteria bacterium]